MGSNLENFIKPGIFASQKKVWLVTRAVLLLKYDGCIAKYLKFNLKCKTLPLAAIQFFIYFKEELNSDKTLAVNNKRSTYDTNLQLNHIMFIYRIFAANLLINVTLSIKFKKAK